MRGRCARKCGASASPVRLPILKDHWPTAMRRRTMAAIVLDREQANQQKNRRRREQERQPKVTPRTINQSRHQKQEWQPRVEKLRHGAPMTGTGIGHDYLLP